MINLINISENKMSPTIILPLLKQESETVDKCYICDEKFKDFDAHFETFHGQENDIKEFKCKLSNRLEI